MPDNQSTKKGKKVAIFSFCGDDWGGSEELWSRGLGLLQGKAVAFTLYKKRINFSHPEMRSLAKSGVRLRETEPLHRPLPLKIQKAAGAFLRHFAAQDADRRRRGFAREYFYRRLKADRPDLVIIAQGINFDGLPYAHECLRLAIPYVLIAQKAVDFYWPPLHERDYMKTCYQKAVRCFFVSRHNQRLTEEQLGIRLSNSCVITNPVTIPVKALPFPDTSAGIRLACVARLFLLDKGQDMLLRILAKPLWRSRPMSVSLAGTGTDETGLREMAKLLKLNNIRFLGQVTDIAGLWATHHALVLPSRSEGLPLSILEAMAAGRPAIVSNAGGNAEIVTDGVTGFVGEACEASFEDAMERAWNKRDKWSAMGQKASETISDRLSEKPETTFAGSINDILS
ncbi:MAG TPA: glycosyltransferase family 4 protein [Chitinophagaceae bacterium]|nr:glycosyltransferase family 4 protein [Chitinophagaceae bacterium]